MHGIRYVTWSLAALVVACGQAPDVEHPEQEEALPPTVAAATLGEGPVFGPDSFPAFAPLADTAQLTLAQHGCLRPYACRDYERMPRVTTLRLFSTPNDPTATLGTMIVVAVGARRGEMGGTLTAYYLPLDGEEAEPVAVDVEGGWYAWNFHYAFRRLADGWVELAEGPWGESAWMRLDHVRGNGGLVFVTSGDRLDFDGREWTVFEADTDGLVLKPAYDISDHCSGERLEPIPDSLARSVTRAELTDARGHFLFRIQVVIC